MTTRLRAFLRRAAVLTAAVVTPIAVASPAGADVPEGWSDPEPVSGVHALLVLGAIPLLLFVVIALAVYLPAVVKGERVAPGSSTPDDEWFGGPRSGTRELSSGSETDGTGGASGRW